MRLGGCAGGANSIKYISELVVWFVLKVFHTEGVLKKYMSDYISLTDNFKNR